MAKRTILVTGANGQVGKELQDLAAHHPELRFIFQGRNDLPLENFVMLRTVLENVHPDVCINCAAYTAVDKAEQEKDLAFQVNAEAVGVMAAVCKETGTRFIHISTDYVFPGNGTEPYLEDDPTGPVNVYGASKLAGELEALQLNADSIIIRTSWVYSTHGRNFLKTMVRLMAEKETVKVVSDQQGCPTYAADLAAVLLKIALMERVPAGIYHYSNQGVTTWHGFAEAIGTAMQTPCKVVPITTEEFPTPARRPVYSVLDCSKIVHLLGEKPRRWEVALQDCMAKLS